MKYKKIKLIYFFVALVIALGVLWLAWWFFSSSTKKVSPRPQPVVSTYVVSNKTWQPTLQSIGNIKALQSIILSSEVAGIITHINFASGQKVNTDQVILSLRANTIKADLEKAKLTLQNDLYNYQQRKKLLASHYISTAEVRGLEVTVKQDEAIVKKQQALLAQHSIAAPFTGVLSIFQVQVGQYITPGQALVSLEAIDSVYVDFPIPEKLTSRIKVGTTVSVKSDAYPDDIFNGYITATANNIDITNRSLMIRAIIANQNKKLLSGMSAKVFLKEPMKTQIVIPQSALVYTPEGTGVYFLDEKNIVHWRTVVIAQRLNDEAIISSGLKTADRIVLAGQQKIQEGIVVAINNPHEIKKSL